MLRTQIGKALLALLAVIVITKLLTKIFFRFTEKEYKYINERLIGGDYNDLIDAINYYDSSSFNRFMAYKIICFILIAFSWYFSASFNAVFQNTYWCIIIRFILGLVVYYILYTVVLSFIIWLFVYLGRSTKSLGWVYSLLCDL